MKCFMSYKKCDCKSESNRSQVFLISPFGYPFEDVYREGLKPILSKINCREINSELPDSKLQLIKANDAQQLGFVMCQKICKQIQDSEFIIADISKPNPNVFYELGLSYGMNKKIILIGQKKYKNTFISQLDAKEKFYIQYQSIKDFQDASHFIKAFKNPLKNPTKIPEISEAKIVNIINNNSTIQGIHEKTLRDSIEKLKEDKKIEGYWKVKDSMFISSKTKINEIIRELIDCKICIIDTSVHGDDESDISPYIFFCLGLSHGFQKEVVPLTYKSQENTSLPFDVRGLWHIFYKDLKQLKEQFMDVMPQIEKHWKVELDDYLYKKIWNPFLSDIYIMTCGRNQIREGNPRMNIDKWDYNTVSELTHFFTMKFATKKIVIDVPKSKLLTIDIKELEIDKIEDNICNQLKNKDCIIIGSPDVSDLAEIVLSRLYKIKPYKKIEPYKKKLKFKGFMIKKNSIGSERDYVYKSSFYCQISKNNGEEGIVCRNKKGKIMDLNNKLKQDGDEEIYGVLTIANNPFDKRRKIMIFSGFSGIATYGIAKLLTDEKFQEQLRRLDAEYKNRDQNVQIIICTTFSKGAEGIDDSREFKNVSFVQMMPF